MLCLRPLTPDEHSAIDDLRRSRTASIRLVERAYIIWLASQGWSAPAIANAFCLSVDVVRRWLKRFDAAGLAGLQDAPRPGRPVTYTAAEVDAVVATALTDPRRLGQPFDSWTLGRLAAYLNTKLGISIKRSRIADLLIEKGVRSPSRHRELAVAPAATPPGRHRPRAANRHGMPDEPCLHPREIDGDHSIRTRAAL